MMTMTKVKNSIIKRHSQSLRPKLKAEASVPGPMVMKLLRPKIWPEALSYDKQQWNAHKRLRA